MDTWIENLKLASGSTGFGEVRSGLSLKIALPLITESWGNSSGSISIWWIRALSHMPIIKVNRRMVKMENVKMRVFLGYRWPLRSFFCEAVNVLFIVIWQPKERERDHLCIIFWKSKIYNMCFLLYLFLFFVQCVIWIQAVGDFEFFQSACKVLNPSVWVSSLSISIFLWYFLESKHCSL